MQGDNDVQPNAVYAAAHELKSPLALIRQLALSLESDVSSQQQAVYIRRIVLTSERALRTTSDLTRAARLEDSLFEVEPVNPVSICQEVSRSLQPLYSEHGRVLQSKILGRSIGGYQAVANPELLSRIIINFCDNALHYGSKNTAIHLRVSRIKQGATVRVIVRDYGPALPFSFWKQLRDRLGVTAQPLHQRPESSGLGLQLCGQFARSMGAHIGIVRHHDGTSFYVDLPACRQLSLL